MKNKNRKSFIAVVQINKKGGKHPVSARVYRVKRNQPDLIGMVEFGEMFKSTDLRDYTIVAFLKYNGHVLSNHVLGREFFLSVV